MTPNKPKLPRIECVPAIYMSKRMAQRLCDRGNALGLRVHLSGTRGWWKVVGGRRSDWTLRLLEVYRRVRSINGLAEAIIREDYYRATRNR